MSQILVPSSDGRSNFLRVVQMLAAKFSVTEQQIIESYKIYDNLLKMPQLLSPATTAYSFNPVKAVDTPVPGENKIDKNDFFAVTGIGLRFTRATYTEANGQTSLYGNFDEYTYPYAAVFSGAAEQSALMTIVRGMIGLSVTGDQQWALPCSELVYKNEYINDEVETIQYGGSEGQRGIFPLQSIVVLDGGADNLLTLNLLTGTTTNIDGSVTSTTTRNFVMPVLAGFVIKNLAGTGMSQCRV